MLKKIPPSLLELVDEGIIDDVLTRLLSGKEASIFIVEKDDELVAAKVYKAREQRTFKHVASYVSGRNQTRNSRDKRAQQRKTSYGRELMETGWREMEMNALQRAFYAGVRVPQPYLLSGDVLLMELLVDESGSPAPRLADLELTHSVAKLLHEEVYQQVRRLLTADLIHADLSAYNILYAVGGIHLIDLPQAVDATANREARDILHRDLKNVTEHLAKYDARLNELLDCGAVLFDHYTNGTIDRALTPEGSGAKRSRRRRAQKRDRQPLAPAQRSPQESPKTPAPASTPGRAPTANKRGPVIERRPSVRPAQPVAPVAAAASDDTPAPKKKKRRRRRRPRRPPTES